ELGPQFLSQLDQLGRGRPVKDRLGQWAGTNGSEFPPDRYAPSDVSGQCAVIVTQKRRLRRLNPVEPAPVSQNALIEVPRRPCVQVGPVQGIYPRPSRFAVPVPFDVF